jgi:hypothetical protein
VEYSGALIDHFGKPRNAEAALARQAAARDAMARREVH